MVLPGRQGGSEGVIRFITVRLIDGALRLVTVMDAEEWLVLAFFILLIAIVASTAASLSR